MDLHILQPSIQTLQGVGGVPVCSCTEESIELHLTIAEAIKEPVDRLSVKAFSPCLLDDFNQMTANLGANDPTTNANILVLVVPLSARHLVSCIAVPLQQGHCNVRSLQSLPRVGWSPSLGAQVHCKVHVYTARSSG